MSALSVPVVDRFADLCHLAYRSWNTWRGLREGVKVDGDFGKGMSLPAATALHLVLRCCEEHAVLQIAKLHDPATVARSVTLSLDFVLKYGGWDPANYDRLAGMKKELDGLAAPLRDDIRNMRLAHNDLAAVLAKGDAMIFEPGQDARYFDVLWEFLRVVYVEVKGADFGRSEEARGQGSALAEWLSRRS